MKMRAQHAAVSAQNYMISTTLQLEPSHAIMATEVDSPAVQKLNQYQEALHWLHLAVQECQKTENVDLGMLISSTDTCAQCVQQLLLVETNQVRKSALEQLSDTLSCHQETFALKQRQLLHHSDGKMLACVNGEGALSTKTNGDDQDKRRTRVIEDTIMSASCMKFDHVAGLEQAKQALREAIILPVMYPHLFTEGRLPWSRVLLYGPPGTGKTRLAQAVSGEIQSTFYSVSSSDLISSWVGESEKLIRDLFQHAKQGKGKSVIFIDEVDSVCRQRNTKEEEHTRRVKTELLRQMDGANTTSASNKVLLLCATNCPWELDLAFLRRFQRKIYIPLPCRTARQRLFQLHLGSKLSHSMSPSDWDVLVTRSEGFSGSDIATCVADALLEPVRELEQSGYWKCVSSDEMFIPCAASDIGATKHRLTDFHPEQVTVRDVQCKDFLSVLERCHRTVSEEELAKFEEFTQRHGQVG